jgi:plastocyanin
MMMRYVLAGIAVTLTMVACGKGKEEAGTTTQQAESPSTPAAAPQGGGSVNGTVRFTGAAPENPAIDMGEEPECQKEYQGTPRDPIVVVNDGKLANVVVYVKSGLPANQKYPVPTDAVTLDQNGCLYHPKQFAVMAGQKIEVKNSDPVLHNIKAVPKLNRGFNISQPKEGMTTTRTFSTPEENVPVECNVHGWMHANIVVLPHPFFATTGPDGSFTIKGLPPGTYQLEAHHPKLGTKTASVTVQEGGTATTDFTFGPAA